MARCEKISISLHKEVIEKIEKTMILENRNRSNVVETILRKHYGLGNRVIEPYKKSRPKLYAEAIKKVSL